VVGRRGLAWLTGSSAQLEARAPVSTGMRLRLAPALLPILLALCVVAGPARAASSRGHLDRGFGDDGTASAVVPGADREVEGFTVAADGRVYVLDGSTLVAFGSDGEVATEFGEGGQVDVAPAAGNGHPRGLAVDPQGRVLVVGAIEGSAQGYFPSSSVYVLRVLPDGSRDPEFGSGGEVVTDFGLAGAGPEPPTVSAGSILVDSQGRPVIGGSYGETSEPCGVNISGGPSPFVARLTASGEIDNAFGHAGHAILGEKGGVESLARSPAGGLVVFSTPCSTPPRAEARAPVFTDLTENGDPVTPAVHGALDFSWVAPRLDPKGRIIELESPPPAAIEYEPSALVRVLPNGHSDRSFGKGGRVVLRKPREPFNFAVDPAGRPVIVSASKARGTELRRLRLDGRPDPGFGPGGVIAARIAIPSALAFDAGGRIYTLSLTGDSTRRTIKVARFVPGTLRPAAPPG
jgi:uncharacterized delta-60 repeat protein